MNVCVFVWVDVLDYSRTHWGAVFTPSDSLPMIRSQRFGVNTITSFVPRLFGVGGGGGGGGKGPFVVLGGDL